MELKEKRQRDDNRRFMWFLPLVFLLLSALMLALGLGGNTPLDTPETRLVVTYDFAPGLMPEGTDGTATLLEEDGRHALLFNEIGDEFESAPIVIANQLQLKIYYYGLTAVGPRSLVGTNPVFTAVALDEAAAPLETATISSVTLVDPSIITFQGGGTSFTLTMSDFAVDVSDPQFALSVSIQRILVYDFVA